MREPSQELVISREDGVFVGDIDVVIVPGVDFDNRCNRMATGKGTMVSPDVNRATFMTCGGFKEDVDQIFTLRPARRHGGVVSVAISVFGSSRMLLFILQQRRKGLRRTITILFSLKENTYLALIIYNNDSVCMCVFHLLLVVLFFLLVMRTTMSWFVCSRSWCPFGFLCFTHDDATL